MRLCVSLCIAERQRLYRHISLACAAFVSTVTLVPTTMTTPCVAAQMQPSLFAELPGKVMAKLCSALTCRSYEPGQLVLLQVRSSLVSPRCRAARRAVWGPTLARGCRWCCCDAQGDLGHEFFIVVSGVLHAYIADSERRLQVRRQPAGSPSIVSISW
jgi:hypothetical protein